MGFVTHHEVKQRLVGDQMRAMVVSEFSMGDVVSPRFRVVPTEDLEVRFDFLVYSFNFSIQLRVVGHGEGEVVFHELSKFASKGRCELGALVGYDFVVEAKAEVDFVEKECSDSFGSNVFLCGT